MVVVSRHNVYVLFRAKGSKSFPPSLPNTDTRTSLIRVRVKWKSEKRNELKHKREPFPGRPSVLLKGERINDFIFYHSFLVFVRWTGAAHGVARTEINGWAVDEWWAAADIVLFIFRFEKENKYVGTTTTYCGDRAEEGKNARANTRIQYCGIWHGKQRWPWHLELNAFNFFLRIFSTAQGDGVDDSFRLQKIRIYYYYNNNAAWNSSRARESMKINTRPAGGGF